MAPNSENYTIKMGKKIWIYRLRKEDFAHVAKRLNVALESRLDEMTKALSKYYSETEKDPQLVDRAGSNIPRQSRPKHYVNER